MPTGRALITTWQFREVLDVAVEVGKVGVLWYNYCLTRRFWTVCARYDGIIRFPSNFSAWFCADIAGSHYFFTDVHHRLWAAAKKPRVKWRKKLTFGKCWGRRKDDSRGHSWEGWSLTTVEGVYGLQGTFGSKNKRTRCCIEGDDAIFESRWKEIEIVMEWEETAKKTNEEVIKSIISKVWWWKEAWESW